MAVRVCRVRALRRRFFGFFSPALRAPAVVVVLAVAAMVGWLRVRRKGRDVMQRRRRWPAGVFAPVPTNAGRLRPAARSVTTAPPYNDAPTRTSWVRCRRTASVISLFATRRYGSVSLAQLRASLLAPSPPPKTVDRPRDSLAALFFSFSALGLSCKIFEYKFFFLYSNIFHLISFIG